MLAFNKPFFVGNEQTYIADAVTSGKISGNGKYTKKCHDFFENRFDFNKCYLTTSCTDALEMASILIDCMFGDEIIVPSYTFTSTANPFILRGAKVVFADSNTDHPNISANEIEKLITPNTKAIVVVHYAGMACDMDRIMQLANANGIVVIEDAAQAISSYYKGKPLGSIGHLSAFSFHETKNIISGEGGMLVVNDEQYVERAEFIWEKGTNRAAFFRGEVDKYNWIDVGSSFLPSDITAAFLYAQLENLDKIQNRRIAIWKYYYDRLIHLSENGYFQIVSPSSDATINGHIFAIVCSSPFMRKQLLTYLNKTQINAVFHYLSLHSSPFFKSKHDERSLTNADRFSDSLIRLPFYYELQDADQQRVITAIQSFFNQ